MKQLLSFLVVAGLLAFATGCPKTSTGTGPKRGTGTGAGTTKPTDKGTGAAVDKGKFTLSAAPAELTVKQGKTGTSDITIERKGNFKGEVALSVEGGDEKVKAALEPAKVGAEDKTSKLTVTADAAAEDKKVYTLKVTGKGEGVSTQTTEVKVTIEKK